MRLSGIWPAVVALATALASPSPWPPSDVRTVEQVDLGRYLGTWYELARFDNRFQRKCTGDVTATYARRSDGRLSVLNACSTPEGPIQAEGVARIVDGTGNAKLKVRFAPAWLSWLPAVWGDYWVIGLDADYRWAVVGDPGRKYLWVLSRTPSVDESTYARAVETARAQGFDVSRLIRTPQK